MSLSLVQSRALLGLDAAAVTVEVHLANGLPGFMLVGLADVEVKEARERVRSAIQNSGLEFPHNKRITVNLAPADLPKDSGRFDLPIALGILAAGGQNAQGNWQVKAPRVLGQISRRQVNRDAFVMRKFQPRVLNRRAHPFPRFLDLDIGQTHQHKPGQAVGQMYLHRDRGSIQPQQGSALNQRQTHENFSLKGCAIGTDTKLVRTSTVPTVFLYRYLNAGYLNRCTEARRVLTRQLARSLLMVGVPSLFRSTS